MLKWICYFKKIQRRTLISDHIILQSNLIDFKKRLMVTII